MINVTTKDNKVTLEAEGFVAPLIGDINVLSAVLCEAKIDFEINKHTTYRFNSEQIGQVYIALENGKLEIESYAGVVFEGTGSKVLLLKVLDAAGVEYDC